MQEIKNSKVNRRSSCVAGLANVSVVHPRDPGSNLEAGKNILILYVSVLNLNL